MRSLATSRSPVSPSAPSPSWQPRARHDRLVRTEVTDETLVYDLTTDVIHHLNPTSQTVWSLCDGTRTVQGIAPAASGALGAQVSDVVVRLALGQLAAANLLVDALPTETGQSRSSRRTVLRRMAIAGGVALPALVSVSAPVAADSHSNPPVCTFDGSCTTPNTPCCIQSINNRIPGTCLDTSGSLTCQV